MKPKRKWQTLPKPAISSIKKSESVSSPAKIDEFCICLNRDTGFIFSSRLAIPIERNPIGLYVLHVRGTKNEIERHLKKYQNNPSLLKKYMTT